MSSRRRREDVDRLVILLPSSFQMTSTDPALQVQPLASPPFAPARPDATDEAVYQDLDSDILSDETGDGEADFDALEGKCMQAFTANPS
jgi:hypothetical protein